MILIGGSETQEMERDTCDDELGFFFFFEAIREFFLSKLANTVPAGGPRHTSTN